eukprot:CAMPEP_0176083428 /NCGR_PEP_ID=MMETSP0120_2-20121206/41739_1 /TAXON_ID=160619 /ORGANISM="Kryptoperidinium foliaceum, Strain CCMP 1326" /LENGTH=42 /DNA_ID= /DNA_START= /DNA_END= /DNA_ORIENTATION=
MSISPWCWKRKSCRNPALTTYFVSPSSNKLTLYWLLASGPSR